MTLSVHSRRLWYPQTSGLGFLAHGAAAPLPDPKVVKAAATRPRTGWTNHGLTIPVIPELENRDLPHQLKLTVTSRRDVALGCNCGASIETRSCWAASDARKVWTAWHESEGITV